MEKWVGIPIFFSLINMEIITDKVKTIFSGLLEEKAIALVDITYKRQGPNTVLMLIVDKKGGVTVDECAWVSQKLGDALDKDNIITEKYVLEVSSPGLDRPLKAKKDFERAKGELVRINTYGPIEDKREHTGKVFSCDEEFVTIEVRDTNAVTKIPLNKIAKACLIVDF